MLPFLTNNEHTGRGLEHVNTAQEMLLTSPKNLHYPITVTQLLQKPGDSVERFAPLFSYFYKSLVTEGNKDGEKKDVEWTFPQRFESETEGQLVTWKIQEGEVIAAAGYANASEPLQRSH